MEKWKTGMLTGLILLSFVQVGIHWNRQVQGNPLRLTLAWVEAGGQTFVDERLLSVRKADYISPSRIIVSDEASFRWMLEASGAQWQAAWADLKGTYLPLLTASKPDKTQPRATWEQLLSSRRFLLYEFEHPVPAELLPWISGTGSVRNGFPEDAFPDIEKIAIIPSESVNATVNSLFVLASDGVYRFTVTVPSGALPKNWYVMDQEALDVGGNRQVAMISTKYGLNTVRQDTMVIDDEVSLEMPEYEAVLPEAIPDSFTADKLQPLQESILLNRKDSLLTRVDEKAGEVTFSDMENVFHVRTDGLFTYRYLPRAGDGGAQMGAAFRQAVAFLDERGRLLGDTPMVLTGITPLMKESDRRRPIGMKRTSPVAGFSAVMEVETAEASPDPSITAQAYTFTFAYRVDGYLVQMSSDSTAGVMSPITLTANAERVISCDWAIRRFTPVSTSLWSVFFFDMYNDAVLKFPLLGDVGRQLLAIRIGYRFPANGSVSVLSPEWLLMTQEETLTLPMRQGVE